MKKRRAKDRSESMVQVPQRAVFLVLSTVAGVLEEPYCAVGRVEASRLVAVHRALCRALGEADLAEDYAWHDGKVVSGRDRSFVIREPVDGEPWDSSKLGGATCYQQTMRVVAHVEAERAKLASGERIAVNISELVEKKGPAATAIAPGVASSIDRGDRGIGGEHV